MRDVVLGGLLAVLLLGGTVGALALFAGRPGLLVVSYDATRELWAELNQEFAARQARETGRALAIRSSHGGSTSQARAVLEGLRADVVSLALWSDVDALRVRGLVAADWEARFPVAYHSTIVFVVRAGNPKGIADWADLVRDGVTVVTPNPRTSGNGRVGFLAAWGAVRLETGSEERAREFVRALYRRIPVLDTGARGAALTFAQKQIGDVLLAWENEAHLLRGEYPDRFQIVYPSRSLRADPQVAVVERGRGQHPEAEALVRFLHSEAGQEILARHHYRPADAIVAARHRAELPELELFTLDEVVPGGWKVAQAWFADGGEFDRLTTK